MTTVHTILTIYIKLFPKETYFTNKLNHINHSEEGTDLCAGNKAQPYNQNSFILVSKETYYNNKLSHFHWITVANSPFGVFITSSITDFIY